MEFLEALNPNLLALMAAISFAVAQTFYRQALGKISVSAATIIVNAVLCTGGLLTYWASGGVERWAPMGILWFALVGLIGPFFGRYMNYLSLTLIGLARTHVMSQTMPVWSAMLAVAVLGERISWAVGLGTMGILAGALLLVREREKTRAKAPLHHYLVPVAGALALSLTPTLRKLGFAYIPSVPFGLVVAMGVGMLLQAATYRLFEKTRNRRWERNAVLLAIAGGGLNFVAAMSFWTAIKTGNVVSVVPITRLSVLFVLAISWLFLRKQEALTWRVAAGAAVALAGAILITVSR